MTNNYLDWIEDESEYPLVALYPLLRERLPDEVQAEIPYEKENLKRSCVMLANQVRVSLEVNLYQLKEWYAQEKLDFLRILVRCANREFGTLFIKPKNPVEGIVVGHQIIGQLAEAERSSILMSKITNPETLAFVSQPCQKYLGENMRALILSGSRIVGEGGALRHGLELIHKDLDMRIIVKKVEEETLKALVEIQKVVNQTEGVDLTLETTDTLSRLNWIINKPGVPNLGVVVWREEIFLPEIRMDKTSALIASAAQYWGLVNRIMSLNEKISREELASMLRVKLKTPKYVAALLDLGETESMKLAQSISGSVLAAQSIPEIRRVLGQIRTQLRREIISTFPIPG